MQSIIKNINFIILQILILCCSSSKCDRINEDDSSIKFGIIADIQYCDCDSRGNRYYKNSLQKLDECVDSLNKAKVLFTVNLGDLVDRDAPKNLDSVLVRLDKLNSLVYNLTGNHDYGNIQGNSQLYKRLDIPREYYSFKKGKWNFIMLNTNEIATYSNMEGIGNKRELEDMLQKIKEDGRPNGANYNGGISKKQMDWLKQQLEKSQHESVNTLVFSHHPLYGVKGLTALNDIEIIDLLSNYTTVKGVISGHHHGGAFDVTKGIPFITTEGMVETETSNAFGIATIYPDRIEIKGVGRTKSYTIKLKEK